MGEELLTLSGTSSLRKRARLGTYRGVLRPNLFGPFEIAVEKLFLYNE